MFCCFSLEKKTMQDCHRSFIKHWWCLGSPSLRMAPSHSLRCTLASAYGRARKSRSCVVLLSSKTSLQLPLDWPKLPNVHVGSACTSMPTDFFALWTMSKYSKSALLSCLNGVVGQRAEGNVSSLLIRVPDKHMADLSGMLSLLLSTSI